eukprot:TRINITY_DN948_c0_g7_i1.p1 TRINITY_DN948_c0_g7~~TRINITY_DN948_c0_g7_i1.p1  ORF type:complete len:517 (+),score=248.03 TRINITY_DN948_c0_g7_i1:96-1646(+)
MALGIGANDVANAFGTSVGSKSITLKQAVIIASIFEFAGAFLVGSSVAETIKSGIINIDDYTSTPEVLMLGMFSALISGAIWLGIASWLKLPVSTTHSIVGAVVGFSIVAQGFDSVKWGELGFIALSWVTSPVISGILAFLLFLFTKKAILKSQFPFYWSLTLMPLFWFLTFTIVSFSIIYKGTPSLNLEELPIWQGIVISIAIGLLACSISFFFIRPIILQYIKCDQSIYKRMTKLQALNYLICCSSLPSDSELIEDKMEDSINNSNDRTCKFLYDVVTCSRLDEYDKQLAADNINEENEIEKEQEDILRTGNPNSCWIKCKEIALKIAFPEKSVEELHAEAEDFNPQAESVFSSLQVLTACFASFSHGANDVANAIGPLAAIIDIYSTGVVQEEAPVATWILALGGVGIVIGLAIWGYRVIFTIGRNLTKVTPSRGFNMELATATTVISASTLGLPISTTHAQVGSVTGVGFASGKGAINWWLFANILASWIVTLPFTAGSSALIYLIISKICL